MINAILCIDDQPIRYESIDRDDVAIVTTCRMEDYRFQINRHKAGKIKIIGVMLDHDMPFQNGAWFAERIREDLHVPVALTSNNRSGRDRMFDILADYEVPVVHADCTWPDWQTTALRFIFGR